MSRIIIALGGNALGNSPEEQLKIVKSTAKPIVDLIDQGHELIIAHGNGPQVGTINLALETASNSEVETPNFKFPECGAMSQGYIGFHLQNAIRTELLNRGINKTVATVVTQVIVDKNDPAFLKPTKPIGNFYSKEEAKEIEEKSDYKFVEDAGRGYRRVVPSPKPITVVEKDIVKTMVETGYVVITVGGGGIPVVECENNELKGVEVVIDKDFASAKIGEELDADIFIVLTAVDRVAINFNKPNQKFIEKMTIQEAYQLMEEGHFAPGSMLPKVKAAIGFVKSGENRTAIIASLENACLAIKGESGTKIVK